MPCWLLVGLLSCLILPGCASVANQGGERALRPTDIRGLVSFWDFQQPPGSSRTAVGSHPCSLQEMNGPIQRAEDGLFGAYSMDIAWGQWLRIKRGECPALDIHGSDAEVSVVSWIKREADRNWQFIAGMWNERDEKRQYALFTSGHRQSDYTTYTRTPARHQTHGYVSAVGGATPDRPFAFSYATGKTFLETNRWYMIAFTYDGGQIKVYVDGQLDENGNYNPFVYEKGILDAGESGSDFTVAQRAVPKWPEYPEGVPHNVGFSGHMAGLAVYDRALTADEMASLYRSTTDQ